MCTIIGSSSNSNSNSNSNSKLVPAALYFLYFGTLGIFLPYFNLYCYHLGFSGFQIGVLSSLRTVSLLLFPLFWGIIADRYNIRKPIYILCNFLSAFIWLFYLFTVDYMAIVIITICYSFFYTPLIAFLEAFTMDILSREKQGYGRVGVWGSVSFILAVIILGPIIDVYSIKIILVLIFAGSLLQAFISTKIPPTTAARKKSFLSGTKYLLKNRVMIFLFCSFLMLVSHGTYYGFFSIHLENLGCGNTFIGITWALASISEILVMIKSDRIFQRFSIEDILMFSFMVAAFRWFILFFIKDPWTILFTQVLHAGTYGAFHVASILYIDLVTPVEAKTLGQAVNNGLTYGLGLTVGFLITGALYKTAGLFFMFAFSGFVALFAGMLFKYFRMTSSRSIRGSRAPEI